MRAGTREVIQGWLTRARTDGATHMLVICDTFSWEDYPVYVLPGQDPHEVAKRYDDKNMQLVVECYSMRYSDWPQLDAHRAWNWN